MCSLPCILIFGLFTSLYPMHVMDSSYASLFFFLFHPDHVVSLYISVLSNAARQDLFHTRTRTKICQTAPELLPHHDCFILKKCEAGKLCCWLRQRRVYKGREGMGSDDVGVADRKFLTIYD